MSYCCPSVYSFNHSGSFFEKLFSAVEEITKFDINEIIPGVKQLLLNNSF